MQIKLVPTLLAIGAVCASFVAAAPASESNNDVATNEESLGSNLKKKKHDNDDSDSDSSVYTGTATWYSPKKNGGTKAACGAQKIGDDSEIVALNAPQYGKMSQDSDWCGKQIEITGEKGTTVATILDACPECNEGDLDLTPVLFTRVVGDKDQGVGEISWKLI